MALFRSYSGGGLWARNDENIAAVRLKAGDPRGVYILYDGSTPMYVGKGRIWKRLKRHHRRESSKSSFWDHFAWFSVPKPELQADLEALMIRMLPFFLRALNKQIAKLSGATRFTQENTNAIYVKKPKLLRAVFVRRTNSNEH